MALGQYKIKVVPVLDTASLHNQLEQAGVKGGKVGKVGQAGGEAYANGFTRALKERFKYSIANALIYGTQNAVKDMVKNVIELDKAQTELKKVTDLTGKSLEDYTDRAFKMSGAVAKTGTEIVQAATEFSKQGFGTEDALALSKIASEFQNIADTEIDAATAAKFINSQLKAFGNTEGFKQLTSDAEKAEKVIDAVNEVANNFGVGTNDLQMALTKTGAALKGYGNSYSETIGLITAGTEMLPNQASKVARGWRTIGANILKFAQDEEVLQVANGKVNISLRDSQGNMKSTYEILKQLHEGGTEMYHGVELQSTAWEKLSQEEQSSISLMLAGKTQTEVFKSTMDNFTQAIKANETAQKSQGSAARENAKYLDSIQGHMASFQSAWQKLSHDLVDSGIVKGFLDIGTTIINVVDDIVIALDKLPGKYSGLIGLLTLMGGLGVGAKKLTGVVEGLLGFGKAAEVAAEGAEAATVATGGSLIGSLSALGSALLPLAPALIALGGAFIYANYQYKNSFKGKTEEYEKLGNEILGLQEQIEALESREGDLTAEEESRLSILKMQLKVLQQQEELKHKQLTAAFDKDAKEKMRGKVHKEQGEDVVVREDLTGDKYIKAAEKRFALQKKIKHLEDEQRKHPLTEEQTKQLEKYNKELDKVFNNESDALDKLIEEHDALANVDYSKLSSEGKAWYDNTHSAYLQALSDIESVRNAVGEAINTFGSAQFDAWDIDVTSLKNAGDLISQISQKISEMGDEEEITLYARDETGNIIDEVTRKKGELTDEEWELVVNATTTGDYDKLQEYINGDPEHKEVLMDFVEHGIGEVNAQADDAARTRTADVNVTDNGSANKIGGQIDTASKDRNTTVNVKESGVGSVKSAIDSIKGKDVVINIIKKIFEKKQATGKRKGEQGGVAWLGDEGSVQNPKPELVVGEDGAYLAGTQGWELYDVKSSDTVYTYAQTKKLLSGKQTFSGVASELPRFKKGKKKKATKSTPATNANVNKAKQKVNKAKNKKAKEKAKKALEKLQKQRETKRNEFDSKVAQLKHNAKVNHWTDAQYQAEYTNLYNQYSAYLSGDQSNTYTEDHDEYLDTLAKDESERLVGLVSVGGMTAASAVSSINAQTHLTADEKKDYRAKAYKSSVEYNLKEYQNGKATRQQVLNDIQNYYKERGKYDEDYYKMVDELREADKAKELKRLNELQEKEKGKLSYIKKYAQQQKDYYDEQVAKEKEEAEELETLIELQDKLNNAKKTMVKVYREGVGFVYEQDTQAIREAQKALEDYNKEHTKTDLEQKAEAWQKIIDAIGEAEDLSEMKELEVLLGITDISQLTGNIGLDATKWGNLAKTILATEMGLADIEKVLNEANGADIEKLIGSTLSSGDKTISSSLLSQYIAKHSFASGTLSSPSGFSLVGENGPELRYLSRGSTIFSNGISRNLMEWGQFSPAQVLSNVLGGTQSQVFNFDKIVLPNVHNADEFYKELQALPNRAIQQSAFRM